MPVTVPVDDFPAVIAQSSVPSVASVSVDNVGRSFPPQNPPRRVKFLIEWKEHTIPVVLDDTETLGTVAVHACMEIFQITIFCNLCPKSKDLSWKKNKKVAVS